MTAAALAALRTIRAEPERVARLQMILSGLAIANVNAALSTHSRHFHGPAEAGKNAGVVLPIAPAKSRMEGSATLTDAQAADLAAGKWYVNVHTAANKDGEIRGQVLKDN